LTLIFDKDSEQLDHMLNASHITLTGATKGEYNGGARTLAISNITVAEGEAVTVSIANPPGLAISGGSKSVAVHKAAPLVAVAWTGLTANGIPNEADTTALTLSFDGDPVALTLEHITVTGAKKNELTGTGTTRTLMIYGITVAQGESITVAISTPDGAITDAPKTVAVHRAPSSSEYPGEQFFGFAPGGYTFTHIDRVQWSWGGGASADFSGELAAVMDFFEREDGYRLMYARKLTSWYGMGNLTVRKIGSTFHILFYSLHLNFEAAYVYGDIKNSLSPDSETLVLEETWFEFTCETNGRYEFTSYGYGSDPMAYLCTDGTAVAVSDDANGYNFKITVDMEIGETYYLLATEAGTTFSNRYYFKTVYVGDYTDERNFFGFRPDSFTYNNAENLMWSWIGDDLSTKLAGVLSFFMDEGYIPVLIGDTAGSYAQEYLTVRKSAGSFSVVRQTKTLQRVWTVVPGSALKKLSPAANALIASDTLLRFTCEFSGTYTFTSFEVVSNCNPYARLFDADMTLLLDKDDGGTGGNFNFAVELEAGKTYYLLATALYAFGGGYRVRVEPNAAELEGLFGSMPGFFEYDDWNNIEWGWAGGELSEIYNAILGLLQDRAYIYALFLEESFNSPQEALSVRKRGDLFFVDYFDGAVTITAVFIPGDITTASLSVGVPMQAFEQTLFEFECPQDGAYRFGSFYDASQGTYAYLFDKEFCYIGHANSDYGGFRLSADLSAGETYYLLVLGYFGEGCVIRADQEEADPSAFRMFFGIEPDYFFSDSIDDLCWVWLDSGLFDDICVALEGKGLFMLDSDYWALPLEPERYTMVEKVGAGYYVRSYNGTYVKEAAYIIGLKSSGTLTSYTNQPVYKNTWLEFVCEESGYYAFFSSLGVKCYPSAYLFDADVNLIGDIGDYDGTRFSICRYLEAGKTYYLFCFSLDGFGAVYGEGGYSVGVDGPYDDEPSDGSPGPLPPGLPA
ncbi:MAG: hypothetical protein FWD58_10755, partial [Firmicutes bacterium]|nr:hypothetical protein [Bacillota bacterium]